MRLFKLLSACVVACLLWASGPALSVVHGQSYTVEECDRVDEPALQAELESIMSGVLLSESELFDIASIVDRQWGALNVAAVLEEEVDVAIAQVYGESNYWERVLSGWSPGKAEEMADLVATFTLSSPNLQAKLSELASAVAFELAREVETLSAQSASTGLQCLQAYVGAQFSQELFVLFEQSFQSEASDVEIVAKDVVSISPLGTHGKALSGVGAILVATVTRRLAQSLGQQLAGRLAGRITGRLLGRLGSTVVPVAGWIIGAGLIVWDLIEGNKGALPQIRETLTGVEVQATIQQEITRIVRDELTLELRATAALLATTMFGEWQHFCEDYATVCGLAVDNQQVNQVLAQTRVEELPALSVWLDVLIQIGGRTEIERLAGQGTLHDLLALPEVAVAILHFTKQPETVLAWSNLAGDQLAWVVEHNFYTLVSPADLSPALFAKFVTIGNNEVFEKLFALDSGHFETLVSLPTAHLETITVDASISDLTWLSEYLAQVGTDEAANVARQLADGDLSIVTLRSQVLSETDEAAVVIAEPRTPSMESPVQRLSDSEEPIFASPVMVASIFMLLVLIGWGALVAIWRTRKTV